MRHFFYSVRYSVVPINFLLLTITLYSSVRRTLVYNSYNCIRLYTVCWFTSCKRLGICWLIFIQHDIMFRVNQFTSFELAYVDRRVDKGRGTNMATAIGLLLAPESSNWENSSTLQYKIYDSFQITFCFKWTWILLFHLYQRRRAEHWKRHSNNKGWDILYTSCKFKRSHGV
jgi:hypothetical protein